MPKNLGNGVVLLDEQDKAPQGKDLGGGVILLDEGSDSGREESTPLSPKSDIAPPTAPALAQPKPQSTEPAWQEARDPGLLEKFVVAPIREGALGRALNISTETQAARDENPSNPLIRFDAGMKNSDRGVLKGIAEFASEMTTPENILLLAGTSGVGAIESQLGKQAVSKALGAAFSVDMLNNAYQQIPEFKEAFDDKDWSRARQVITKIALSSLMSAAGVKHAIAGSGHPLDVAPLSKKQMVERSREMGRQADAYTAAVPLEDRIAHMSDQELATYRENAPGKKQVKLANAEFQKRQRIGAGQDPNAAQPAEAPLNREQRRAQSAVPEEGVPESEARASAAKEDIARQLGKPLEEMTPEERFVVEDLARQGYGSAAAPEAPPAIPTSPVAPKPPERTIVNERPTEPLPTEPALRTEPQPPGGTAEARAAEPAVAAQEIPKYDFASTQVNLPAPVAEEVRNLSRRIPDEALAQDGREVDPHVTVKYGLHADNADAVRRVLAEEPPVRVRLGKTSIFEDSGSGDVVKVDVDSPDLHRLNAKIASALPTTDTHPTYQPHVTLAYVKPGEGARFSEMTDLDGREIVLDHITFSDKSGHKTDIPLTGKPKPEVTLKPLASEMPSAATSEEILQAAKSRIKSRLDEERGSFSLKPSDEPALFDDLVTVGSHYFKTTTQKFMTWSREMIREFGDWVKPHLREIYRRVSTGDFGSERGSFSNRATEPIVRSPNYEKSKENIIKRLDVSDEIKRGVSESMAEYEKRNPAAAPVTFAEVEAEARRIDPSGLITLDKRKAQDAVILDPALRHSARTYVNFLQDEILKVDREIAELRRSVSSANEEAAKQLEAKIDGMKKQAQALLDILIPARSQDGRNLAYHAMMAKKSFDTEFWLGRAKRAAGGVLTPETESKVGNLTAQGREAQRAATERIIQEADIEKIRTEEGAPSKKEIKARGAHRNRSRNTVGLTREELVEQAVERRVKALEQKAAGEQKEPSPRALTPEERERVSNDPRVLDVRRRIAQELMRVEKTEWTDVLTSLWRAGLLTGPKTHMRNIGGNTLFQALEESSRGISYIPDILMSVATGNRTVHGMSVKAVAKATREAATRGIREAKQIMSKGATEEDLAKVEVWKELNSGSRVVDAYANTVFRSMAAEDKVFRVYAFERSLQEQMRLAKVETPTEAMRAQAIADAEYATFNNENMLATAWNTARNRVKRMGDAGKATAVAMDFMVPFARTPANIVARLIDYTPAGSGVRIGHATYKAITNKAFTPKEQRAISMAFGRGLIGSALIYMGWKLGAAGLLTGAASENEGERNAAEAAGRMPGAIRVGNTWQQVGSLAPAMPLLVVGATMQREATRDMKDEAKRPTAVLKPALRTMLDQPMLTGTKEWSEAALDPGGRLSRAAGRLVGSAVPTIVADAASAMDTSRRDTRADGLAGNVAVSVANRLPGVRNTLPERRDVLGRVEPQSRLAAINPGIGSDALELTDMVRGELIREKVGIAGTKPLPGETDDETRLRRQLVGLVAERELKTIVNDPDYQRLPSTRDGRTDSIQVGKKLVKVSNLRANAMRQAIREAKTLVSNEINSEEYQKKAPAERVSYLRFLIHALFGQ